MSFGASLSFSSFPPPFLPRCGLSFSIVFYRYVYNAIVNVSEVIQPELPGWHVEAGNVYEAAELGVGVILEEAHQGHNAWLK